MCRQSRFGPLGLARLTAIALVVAMGSPIYAVPIMLDDFNSPAIPDVYVISSATSNPWLKQQNISSSMGSQRDVLIQVNGTPVGTSALGYVGDGLFAFGSANAPGTTAILQYDGVDLDSGSTLSNHAGLNLDLGRGVGHNRFQFWFQAIDSGPLADQLDVQIDLSSPTGSARYTGYFPDHGVPLNHVVRFSSFVTSGNFSFANVSGVEITFNGQAMRDVDFELDRIETVPEPTGLALIGIGLLCLSTALAVRGRV